LAADQTNDQRSLLLYLICKLFDGKEDDLKRSVALLYEKHPRIFVNNPRRCLMFSLAAFKFRNDLFFKKCIEIGKVYRNLYKKLFPWILKSVREMTRSEMKLPPFQLQYPINE
jgi:hypothetical protein